MSFGNYFDLTPAEDKNQTISNTYKFSFRKGITINICSNQIIICCAVEIQNSDRKLYAFER